MVSLGQFVTNKHTSDSNKIEQGDVYYAIRGAKFNGENFQISVPTLCPICRSQRRLAYRNDRSLYKSICALTKKPIISMYNPENNFIVWEQKEWWKDNWDALDYGKDFDFENLD